MSENDRGRVIPEFLRNALLWGVGFAAVGLTAFVALRLTGQLDQSLAWMDGLILTARFGIVGFVVGAAFSGFIRLAYRGRPPTEISWVRFGIIGGIFTGTFVPLFLQSMNLLSGDGLVPWALVLDDGLWGLVFGSAAAVVTLKIAQRSN